MLCCVQTSGLATAGERESHQRTRTVFRTVLEAPLTIAFEKVRGDWGQKNPQPDLQLFNHTCSKQPNQNWAEDLKRHFSKEDIQMANRHMKRCSTLLIIRDANQNYNEVSPHTSQNGHHQKVYKKCWRECGERGTVLHCWWECKLVQPLWRIVWRFLKKLKIELPYDSATPLLGIYPEKTKLWFEKIHAPQCSLQHYLQ